MPKPPAAAAAATATATEIVARVDALPSLPVVMATSMIVAQGWKPTAAERAAITARADFFEHTMGLDRTVNIRVVDTYTNTKIGELIYNG